MPGVLDFVLMAPVCDLFEKIIGVEFAHRVQQVATNFFSFGADVVGESRQIRLQRISGLAAEGFKQAGRPGQFSPIIPFMVCKSGRHGVAKIFSVAAVELFIVNFDVLGDSFAAHQIDMTMIRLSYGAFHSSSFAPGSKGITFRLSPSRASLPGRRAITTAAVREGRGMRTDRGPWTTVSVGRRRCIWKSGFAATTRLLLIPGIQ